MSYQNLCCEGCAGHVPSGIVCYEQLAQANNVDGCSFLWGSSNKVNEVATIPTPFGNITATISVFQGIDIPTADYANWACYPNGHPNPADEFDWNLWIFNNLAPTNLTIDFSEPVLNPVLALQSLGAFNQAVNYTFTENYEVIFFDNTVTVNGGTNTIFAQEGECIIYFPGYHTSIGITTDIQDNYSLMDVGIFNEFLVGKKEAAVFIDCDDTVTYRDLLTGDLLIAETIVNCDEVAPELSIIDLSISDPETVTFPSNTVAYAISIEAGTADINGASRPTGYSIEKDYVYYNGKLLTYPPITIDNLSVGAIVHISYVTRSYVTV